MDWAKRARDIISIVTEFPACDVVAAVAERLHRVYDKGLEGHGGVYRVAELRLDDHTFQLKSNAATVKGPLGNALLVVYPYDALHNLLQDSRRIGVFRERIAKTFREAGFTEEILIVADNMKFARFELVEGEDGQTD